MRVSGHALPRGKRGAARGNTNKNVGRVNPPNHRAVAFLFFRSRLLGIRKRLTSVYAKHDNAIIVPFMRQNGPRPRRALCFSELRALTPLVIPAKAGIHAALTHVGS